MPPRRRRGSKKFKLGIRDLRIKLAKAEATAGLAVAAGEKAVTAARKRGDALDVKAQKAMLADAKNAKENLGKAVRSLSDACCNQFLNCDPEFP